ncbi:unnamed protein product, partial [Closterium sp. NIES-54]
STEGNLLVCPADTNSCSTLSTLDPSTPCVFCGSFCGACVLQAPPSLPAPPSTPPPSTPPPSAAPSSPPPILAPPSLPSPILPAPSSSPAPPSIATPSSPSLAASPSSQPPPTTFPTPASPASPASPPPAPSTASEASLSTGAIIGIAAAAGAAVVAVLLLVAILCVRAVRSQQHLEQLALPTEAGAEAAAALALQAKAAEGGGGESANTQMLGIGGVDPHVCRRYSLTDMSRATGDWAEGNRIGSGSFGDVYRGVSPHDPSELWAVKRAKLLTNDFHREVKEMASKHHPHLVRLLGYCVDVDAGTATMEQVLVYEFMENGDLEAWIGPAAPRPLTAQQRVDVLIGAAQGLQYLHEFGIVHRDIKPANILLDSKMQARIADFGLVRLAGGTSVTATRVMGTPGYVDPAYYKTQKATPAADVHSFGVVMLVLITARKAIHMDEDGQTTLKHWVAPLVASSAVATFKDPQLEAPDDLVLRMARLAISCTGMPTASRPSMIRILAELQQMKSDFFGIDPDRAANRIDRELAIGVGVSFTAEIARAENLGILATHSNFQLPTATSSHPQPLPTAHSSSQPPTAPSSRPQPLPAAHRNFQLTTAPPPPTAPPSRPQQLPIAHSPSQPPTVVPVVRAALVVIASSSALHAPPHSNRTHCLVHT